MSWQYVATTCVGQGGGWALLANRTRSVHMGWDLSFTVRVLLGLVAGLALGILIAGTDVA